MKYYSPFVSRLIICLVLLSTPLLSAQAASPAPSVIDHLSFSGQADPEEASFVLKGKLKGGSTEEHEPKLIYSLQSEAKVQVDLTNITQAVELRARIFQGRMKEMVLALRGD